jgi:hypothetical protein
MIEENSHAFLQQLSLIDTFIQLQRLDWQEGEMGILPINALIITKLGDGDFNLFACQYDRTLRPFLTKFVAMTVQLWSHQVYWGINKAIERL